MKKRTVLQEYLLSGAIVVVPSVCLAAEPSGLAPVKGEAGLRSVPVAKSAVSDIRQVQYQAPAEVSTVDAELQKLFAANGQAAPVAGPNHRSQMRPSSIALVQHESKTQNARRASEKSRKPGFFKRLYNRIAGTDAGPSQDGPVQPGQPGTQIPKPPPIDFNMQPSGQRSAAANGVSAQPTGFGNGMPPTYRKPASSGAQPLIPGGQQYRQPGVSRLPAPVPRSVARDDEFINPFEVEAPETSSDALLDLDSLIEDRPAAVTGAQNKLKSAERTAESLLPELSLPTSNEPVRVVARKRVETNKDPENKDPENGPFTGYRLPSDDQVLGLPEPEAETEPETEPSLEPAPTIEAVPVIVPQSPPAPVVAAEEEVEQETSSVVQIPLLEEPAMALPPVADVVAESPVEPIGQTEVLTKPNVVEPEEFVAPVEEEEPKIVPPRFVEAPASSPQTLKALDGRARREQQRYRIMARSGKLGFKGFCPVALRDSRDLVDSREQYKAKFGLQTYYFSTPEAKSAFEADPARYAPAGGGSDVVLLVNTGEETPGSLDFSLWYRDRLYMFRSRETQAMFSKDPRRYADQY